MRTKPKNLGTQLETRIVHQAQTKGLIAERLPEQGAHDQGDIRIYTNHEWIIEAKNRMNLNMPRTLQKALNKSGTPNTAVIWRKMIRQPGNTNRTQDGPTTVAITLNRFLQLLLTETCQCAQHPTGEPAAGVKQILEGDDGE